MEDTLEDGMQKEEGDEGYGDEFEIDETLPRMEDVNVQSAARSPLPPPVPGTTDTAAVPSVHLEPQSGAEILEEEASTTTDNTEEVRCIHASTFCLFLPSSYFYYPIYKQIKFNTSFFRFI